MFTGIVAYNAKIVRIETLSSGEDKRFWVSFPKHALSLGDAARWGLGQSIALNGVCLTVIEKKDELIAFDLSPETLEKSTLSASVVGNLLNYELALAMGDPIGGHQVLGHVDESAVVVSYQTQGDSHELVIQASSDVLPFLAKKGSVAIDGMSLTINGVDDKTGTFWITIIPHTHANTGTQHYQKGTHVNLEIDPLARYVARYVRAMSS